MTLTAGRVRTVGLAAVAVGLALACARPWADSKVVEVAVAANLKGAFEEVAAEFRDKHPAAPQISPTYGASGTFHSQLVNRAPFDLFLSADTEYPNRLADQRLTAGPPFRYAVGRLAVWVPAGSQLDVETRGVKAAAEPGVGKVAVANPRHAPYGRAAEAALKAAGVHDAVAPRLVLGDNVEQAAQFAHTGAADIGFVPLSLALAPNMAERGRYAVVPADLHPPIEQAGVVLAWAKNRGAVEFFRDFLLGPVGQSILARHGYEPPKE